MFIDEERIALPTHAEEVVSFLLQLTVLITLMQINIGSIIPQSSVYELC